MGSNFATVGLVLPPGGRRGHEQQTAEDRVAGDLPMVVIGAAGTVEDLHDASEPVSRTAYYTPLAARVGPAPTACELPGRDRHARAPRRLRRPARSRDARPRLGDRRRTTRSTRHLQNAALDATSYKIWLDNNCGRLRRAAQCQVGRLAGVRPGHGRRSEVPVAGLVRRTTGCSTGSPTRRRSSRRRRTSCEYSQSQLTIRVPCACTFSVRVRWSKFLRADPATAAGASPARAQVIDDGSGYTSVTTTAPGNYVLHGSVHHALSLTAVRMDDLRPGRKTRTPQSGRLTRDVGQVTRHSGS